MASFTFLLNEPAAAVDDTHERYPHLGGSRRHKHSLLTVIGASGLALAASVVVSGVAFTFADDSGSAELQRIYGERRCAPGHSYYASPVNNYASCCSHYATTCCDLHSNRCEHKFEFSLNSAAAVSASNRSTATATGGGGIRALFATLFASAAPWVSAASGGVMPPLSPPAGSRAAAEKHQQCEHLLSLLSCARCSPYAGHYVNSPTLLIHKPNMTVCESFCHEIWEACAAHTVEHGMPHGRTGGGGLASAGDGIGGGENAAHVRFCTQQLGVAVGGRLPRGIHSAGNTAAAAAGRPLVDAAGADAATCFNAGRPAKAMPMRWLALGVPAVVTALSSIRHF